MFEVSQCKVSMAMLKYDLLFKKTTTKNKNIHLVKLRFAKDTLKVFQVYMINQRYLNHNLKTALLSE